MLQILMIAGIVTALAGGFGVWQMNRANGLDAQLGTANNTIREQNVKISDLADTNKQCMSDVDKSNAAIEALKAAEKERARKAEEAIKAAEEESRKHRIAADKFRAAVPKKPQDLCASANDMLTDYIKSRRPDPKAKP
jgi:septal ring factor EnvC (AmiA/AmiB activator)